MSSSKYKCAIILISIAISFNFSFYSKNINKIVNTAETPFWHCSTGSNSSNYIASELITTDERINLAASLRRSMIANGQKVKIPVYAHRFQPSTCGCQFLFLDYTASEQKIEEEISETNELYNEVGLNIELVLIDIIEYQDDKAVVMNSIPSICPGITCDSEGYYASYDTLFQNEYSIPGAINIFCVDVHSPSPQHANFPDDDHPNLIVLKYYNSGWSTMHELGHTFTLYHTFEDYNGLENVTRDENDACFNATTTGDLLADTEATINLEFLDDNILAKTNPQCVESENCNCTYTYINPPKDSCNLDMVINEDVWKNLMNYGSRECARTFSPGQVDRMWDGFLIKVYQGDFDFCLLSAPDNCPAILNLSGIVDYGQYITSSSSIESSQSIQPSNQLHTMHSATTILEPGFRAELGSKVIVKHQPCSCN